MAGKPWRGIWRASKDGASQSTGLIMERIHELRLHPDGRRIAIGVDEARAEAWVARNLLPASLSVRRASVGQ